MYLTDFIHNSWQANICITAGSLVKTSLYLHITFVPTLLVIRTRHGTLFHTSDQYLFQKM